MSFFEFGRWNKTRTNTFVVGSTIPLEQAKDERLANFWFILDFHWGAAPAPQPQGALHAIVDPEDPDSQEPLDAKATATAISDTPVDVTDSQPPVTTESQPTPVEGEKTGECIDDGYDCALTASLGSIWARSDEEVEDVKWGLDVAQSLDTAQASSFGAPAPSTAAAPAMEPMPGLEEVTKPVVQDALSKVRAIRWGVPTTVPTMVCLL